MKEKKQRTSLYVLKRLLKYMISNYKFSFLMVVLCIVIGALLALPAGSAVTVGTVIAFVGLNKNFNQPITQISQQMNFVVMAAAGAERVFALMDEKPEEDHGYVELVNAVDCLH